MRVDELFKLPDEEKIKIIIEGHYSLDILDKLYLSLSTDELKLSVIDKLDKATQLFALKNLESDELKFDYLKKSEFGEKSIRSIIDEMKSDEVKIKSLSLIDDEQTKCEIIVSSVKNEDKKVEAMKLYIKSSNLRCSILERISSEKIKIDNLSLVSDSNDKMRVIRTLNIDTDDKRIKIAKVVNDDDIASDFIVDVEDEEKKIEAINMINSEHNKAKIIGTLEKDEDKIEKLGEINNEFCKAEIIIKLEADTKKLEQLDKLEDKYAKGEILLSIKSDSLKLEKLYELNFTNELDIAKVLGSLESDTLKIQEFKKLENDYAKAAVLSTLKDDNLKLEQLDNIDDEINRARVIAAIVDENIKLEKLDKFENDFAKAEIIQSIDSDEKKVEELKKLDNDLAKASIIIDLDDFFFSQKNAIEGYKNLNSNLAKQLVSNAERNSFSNTFEPSLNSRELIKQELLKNDRTYSSIGLPTNMTIGMEIESEGVMSKTIKKLYKILERQDGDKIKGWETKGDGSLDDGVEVVSPILTDNQKDVEDIYMVCEMMQKCGQTVSENCGGHIHIGADYLTSKEAYVNLFEIWGNCEEVIYKIANEKGDIPRDGIQEFSPPISSKLNDAIENCTINLESEEELDKFIEVIQEVQEERYSGLNLLNVNNGKNTIEFRIPNGSINPDTWIENARLFGRIVQISQKLAEIEKSTEIEVEEQKLLQLRNKIKDENIPEQEKLETMLELLFSEEEREVYKDRYVTNTQILEQTPEDKNPFKETKFKKVDFKKKHTKDEMQEVAMNERLENVNAVTHETTNGFRIENQIENANDRNMEE